uniref:Putative basic tail protein n=1 Tax=Ixodes ricinus TaxID=34613 RepID=A0A0K8RKA1_IXORI
MEVKTFAFLQIAVFIALGCLCFCNDKMAALDAVLSFNGGSIAQANVLKPCEWTHLWNTIEWLREVDVTRIYFTDQATRQRPNISCRNRCAE